MFTAAPAYVLQFATVSWFPTTTSPAFRTVLARLVPERHRLAWQNYRDELAGRIRAKISQRDERLRALTDSSRLGMNWDT